ncbi:unnamed protein product [Amoebophrya sp. A25]|nr:unnamed protein product [Amoebophrya sp. A25]|eukprot:GSA25T00005293001.1
MAIRLTSLSDHCASDAAGAQGIRVRGGTIQRGRVNDSLTVTRAFGNYALKEPSLSRKSTKVVREDEPYSVDNGATALTSCKQSLEADELRTAGGATSSMADCFEQANAIVLSVPSVTRVPLPFDQTENAFIIVACDGLFDVVSDQDAVNLAMEAWLRMTKSFPTLVADESASSMAEAMGRLLIDVALQRCSMDNITVQIILL